MALEVKDENLKALLAEDAAKSSIELAKQLAISHDCTLTLICVRKDPERREVSPTSISLIQISYWQSAQHRSHCLLDEKRKSFL